MRATIYLLLILLVCAASVIGARYATDEDLQHFSSNDYDGANSLYNEYDGANIQFNDASNTYDDSSNEFNDANIQHYDYDPNVQHHEHLDMPLPALPHHKEKIVTRLTPNSYYRSDRVRAKRYTATTRRQRLHRKHHQKYRHHQKRHQKHRHQKHHHHQQPYPNKHSRNMRTNRQLVTGVKESPEQKAERIVRLFKCRRLVRKMRKLQEKCSREIEGLRKKEGHSEQAKSLARKCATALTRLRTKSQAMCPHRLRCKLTVRFSSRMLLRCKKLHLLFDKMGKDPSVTKESRDAVLNDAHKCDKRHALLERKIRTKCAQHLNCFKARTAATSICKSTKIQKPDTVRQLIHNCQRAIEQARTVCSKYSTTRYGSTTARKFSKSNNIGHSKHRAKFSNHHFKHNRFETVDYKKHKCKHALKLHRTAKRKCRKWGRILKSNIEKLLPDTQKRMESRLAKCKPVLRYRRRQVDRFCGDRCKPLEPGLKRKWCKISLRDIRISNRQVKRLKMTLAKAKEPKERTELLNHLKKQRSSKHQAMRNVRCYCNKRIQRCKAAKDRFRYSRKLCARVGHVIPKDKARRKVINRAKRKCVRVLRYRRRVMHRECKHRCKKMSSRMREFKCIRAREMDKIVVTRCAQLKETLRKLANTDARKLARKSLRRCKRSKKKLRREISCYCTLSCKSLFSRYAKLGTLIAATVARSKATLKNNSNSYHGVDSLRRKAQRLAREQARLGSTIAAKCGSQPIVKLPLRKRTLGLKL